MKRTWLAGFLGFVCLTSLGLGATDAELFLVVGSMRRELSSGGIASQIHRTENLDFTHQNSFGGQATTLDLSPSAILGARHIVGDATTIDLPGQTIAHLVLERLPTTSGRTDRLEFVAENNLTDRVLRNLSRFMKPGAKLEIELDPYLKFFFEAIELEEFAQLNPFHAWYNYQVADPAMANLIVDSSEEEFRAFLAENTAHSRAIIADIVATRTALRGLLKQISRECLIPFDHLAIRIKDENTLYHRLQGVPKPNFCKVITLLPNAASLSIEEFNFSRRYSETFTIWAAELPYYLQTATQAVYCDSCSTPHPFWFYDQSFFNETLANNVLSMLAVQKNRPHIVHALEKLGFCDVNIELKTNPHNGRQLVWMVEAVKN
jgi:hypothetical protein